VRGGRPARAALDFAANGVDERGWCGKGERGIARIGFTRAIGALIFA
jgi:hypothetical protein